MARYSLKYHSSDEVVETTRSLLNRVATSSSAKEEYLSKGSYLALSTSKSGARKIVVGKITKVLENGQFKVRLEDKCWINPETVIIDKSDIAALLGRDPVKGTVYGYKISHLFRGRVEHDRFGVLNMFFNPSEEMMDKLIESLDWVAERLDQLKIGFLLDYEYICYEIRDGEYTGKIAGMYMSSKNRSEVKPNRVQINLSHQMIESLKIADLKYVIAHELGHFFEHTLLELQEQTPTLARMCEEFDEFNSPYHVDGNQIKKILNVWKANAVSVKELNGLLPDDLVEKDVLKHLLAHLRRCKAISARDLNLIRLHSKTEEKAIASLKECLPLEHGFWIGNAHSIFTKYSHKNVHEMWAELFAWIVCDPILTKSQREMLPKNLEELGKDVIRLVRANHKDL